MDDYNLFQRYLTILVLKYKFLGRALFESEKLFFKKKSFESIFICGMARSGSTSLLNFLHNTNKFGTHTYQDMPFILSPNLWKTFSSTGYKKPINRLHDDNIKISYNSPEAFEEVFWRQIIDRTMKTKQIKNKFSFYINSILYKTNMKIYISKNNSNIKRISLINKIYPKSKILIPIRHPFSHSSSLLAQHENFIKIQTKNPFVKIYMDLIGHNEFGMGYKPLSKKYKYSDFLSINHWLEQWVYVYKKLMKYLNHKNIKFISYESICKDKDYVKSIFKFLDISDLKQPKNKNFFNLSQKEYTHDDIDQELLKEAIRVYKYITKN